MSRVIKFRAWDNANNEWLNKEDAECLIIRLDGRYEIDRGWVKVFPDLTIEQDTGLRDKNGKKIYEGDILGGMFEGCYIGWCDTTKSFELFNCYEHYCMACDGDILWCELSDSDIDLEIIGNIHKNPELLEGK